MINMTVTDIAVACGAKIYGTGNENAPVGELIIDSRLVKPGDLFAAFRGEKTDGHDYVPIALQKGASCCLTQREVENAGGLQLVVPDVMQALEDIAAAARERLQIPLVGITGSVGKTSAKEMISAVLSVKHRVLKTDKNLNNQIGVPMTLSRITPEHDVAVVEMGISGFGEMHRLSRMVKPQIGVFTVIGHAHLEFLGDLDGVLRAKTEMLDYMDENAILLMNGDDEKLRGFTCRQKKLLFGLGEDCEVRAEEISFPTPATTVCTICYGDRRIPTQIPAYGQHMIYAALAGATVGLVLGMSDEEIAEGISRFETVGRRGTVTDTGFVTLVDDCYNANPDSVRCGVDSLTKMLGRAVCILGDMLELGDTGKALHYGVGQYAAERGVGLVLGCGELTREACRAAGERGHWFESREKLIETLPTLLRRGDCVLVKASRGMHFEEISEAIKLLGDRE